MYGLWMVNGVGVIDPSYNYKRVIFKAEVNIRGARSILIPNGARIAQFLLVTKPTTYNMVKSEDETLKELSKNSKDGFGSTGK